jgi:hypothetical protein
MCFSSLRVACCVSHLRLYPMLCINDVALFSLWMNDLACACDSSLAPLLSPSPPSATAPDSRSTGLGLGRPRAPPRPPQAPARRRPRQRRQRQPRGVQAAVSRCRSASPRIENILPLPLLPPTCFHTSTCLHTPACLYPLLSPTPQKTDTPVLPLSDQ